jgi:hypothetical protein
MPVSINGWPVLPTNSSKLKTFTIPGTNRKITLRADIAPILLALAAEYDKKIASVDGGTFDDWGYAYRGANASSKWSDHSSGTAMDLNATKEGRMGSGPYSWWKNYNRYLKAKALKAKYACVIWGGSTQLGGDYRQMRYWDWMHWAIAPGTSLYEVQRNINRLGIKSNGYLWGTRPTVSTAKVQPGMKNSQVMVVKKALKKEFPESNMTMTDATFGPATQAAWKRWEARCGFSPTDTKPGLQGLTLLGNKYGFRATG